MLKSGNVILVGPMGSGKSAVGRMLAGRLGLELVDSDTEIELRTGVDIPYIFEREGEAGFRVREAEVLDEITRREGVLVATGGGAVLDPRTRERLRAQLRAGKLDERTVEIDVRETPMPTMQVIGGSSMEEIGLNLREMLPGMFQGRHRPTTVKVPEARAHLIEEEQQKLVDTESVARTAIERVEQSGILFVDEIDKIAGREGGQGPDVSREGVQRDILPIVEGTTVNTKHGMVRTDHVLFIAAGAFHVSKPSDLIPELQGRFPIRVELDALGRDEFLRILREPRNALIAQYTALLATEGVTLEFTDEAVARLAELAALVNERTENIGARRLHTVMEKLLDEISFEGPALAGRSITIDASYVDRMLADIVKNEDLSRYIL